MMTIRNVRKGSACLLLGMTVLAFLACTKDSGKLSLREENRTVEEWREQRLQSLLRDNGWLTVVGLHWLREGRNTFGSDERMDIVFPKGKSPGFAGAFNIEGEEVSFEAAEGAAITHNGEPVRTMLLKIDQSGEPTILKMGSLTFYVIEREDRRGIRLKDSESAALKEFSELEYFPIGIEWRMPAHFIPGDSGAQMEVPTILGTMTRMSIAGTIRFEKDGVAHRLIAMGEPGDPDLFLIFGDETNGSETYHGGRFLAATVGEDGETAIIDFNKAYNPPCVFTDYATCPLPPLENRLAFRVEAGEKMYGKHH